MREPNKGIVPGWTKIVVGFFIVAAVFLIVAGSCLLMAEIEIIGAIICIAIGAVCLLFFGCGAFMIYHPGNRIGTVILVGIGILIVGGLLLITIVPSIYVMMLEPVADIEHYRQVWQNPVTVIATVTDHDSYDDDGDTDYRSYITYVHDNVQYKNFPYEDRDEESELTPLGSLVEVQISPKDPTEQIATLKRSGAGVTWVAVFWFAGVAGIYVLVQNGSAMKQRCRLLDTETIQRDIKRKIRSRYMRPFLLVTWIGYGILYWRYQFLLGVTPLVIAGACGAGWLYCMYTTIRDYRNTEEGSFELRRDVLVDKQESSDSESTSYTLFYKSGERSWRANVAATTYSQAKIGDVVTAVYLPKKKRPIVHYDAEGRLR